MSRVRDVIVTFVLLFHLSFGDIRHPIVVDPSECRSLVDLYIVIDGSDSISDPDFTTLKNAVASLIPQIDIAPNKARIGMLVYSSHVPSRSEHPFSDNARYLQHAAMTLQHPRDGTDTALGLKHMREMFRLKGRDNVPKVCVVISDGVSKNYDATAKEAALAKQDGITMIAVGVGRLVNTHELSTIASTGRQVFKLDYFSQLQDRLKGLMTTICPCPVPPALELAKCTSGPRAIGSVRSYQCLDGYLQRGNPSITCRDDSSWTPLSLDFQCVPCSTDTPVIDHGTCGGGDILLGTERMYVCDKGYLGRGDPMIRCLDDATWSLPNFQCVPCPTATPVIEHGTCGGGPVTLGTERTYVCDNGYLGRGDPVIRCLDDATWSLPNFQCVPCPTATPVIDHGTCGGGAVTLGTERMYVCDKGYLGRGDPIIRCLGDATWSLPKFQCVPCPTSTPVIDHGTCGGGAVTLGSQRTYVCDQGYLGRGDPIIRCLDDATWSIPNFQCVPCPTATPMIDHGTCGGGAVTLGTERTYVCDKGYLGRGDPIIRCMDDATWSIPNFQCVPCSTTTPVIDHGTCGGGAVTLGSERRFTCDKGYLGRGDPIIRCLDDATWSIPNFQCVPCPTATPVIDHGTCGGGAVTLGTERMYVCDNGYLGRGDPIIRCLDDATWSLPNFQCVPCPAATPVIDHGTCGGGAVTLGTERTFVCDPGYLGRGDPIIRCLDDATWSLPNFQCVPCPTATPVIDHGTCGGGPVTLGTERTFLCDPGYLGRGDPIIRCLDDATWSLPNFQCVPCPTATPVIAHGTCGGGALTLGTERTYVCDQGYLGRGDPIIRCLDDATWSLPNFQCVPCPTATPVIDHGTCGGGAVTLGTERTFVCDPGYLGRGDPIIRCLDDATWSLPNFQCVPCPTATPVIDHGTCGGGAVTLGTERTYICDQGYLGRGDPIIRCLDDATWSIPNFQCVPCPTATPLIDHGTCGGGPVTLGTERTYVCDKGYLGRGNPIIRCLDDATWSIPNYQCVPCGPTPTLQHGQCGGGESTLGSSRVFTCDPGYLAVGDPTIICQDNAEWSVPQFQCKPCGATPEVLHGTCGGDDYKLGAVRTFVCEPGYAAIGDPKIMCLDDATWSLPDFKCVPCGDTPDVTHAQCGDGGNLVGNQRRYTCGAGFLSVGNPLIECLSTGKWSVPQFECKDCGVPPMVMNAYAQLGPSAIGSRRDYYCEAGYKMYGRGQITCLANGQWEHPTFVCNVITTTTTTTPAPVKTNPNVCDGCRMINGVGFNNHPYDCNMYVQCYVGTRGIEPFYRKCPFGQFWDQDVLTCRPSKDVYCPHDKCRSFAVKGYKHTDPIDCCSYWRCENGKSFGDCCNPGYSFSPEHGQCMPNPGCSRPCKYTDELPGCDKRPGLTETMFQQHIGGGYWVDMHCAPGTAYHPVDCQCSLLLMNIPGKRRQQVCKPELYLPFTYGFEDRSGKNVYIQPENMTISHGAAFFNGHSRIMVHRFSNAAFHGDLVIKFRYRELLEGPTAGKLQALVTNGDCGSDPSIIIAKMPGYVLLGAKTDEPKSFALPTLDKEWKEVIYIHNEKKLEGRVCGASMDKWSWGPVQATHCALQIGHGQGLESYKGHIDDLYIYQCRPRASVLNIDY